MVRERVCVIVVGACVVSICAFPAQTIKVRQALRSQGRYCISAQTINADVNDAGRLLRRHGYCAKKACQQGTGWKQWPRERCLEMSDCLRLSFVRHAARSANWHNPRPNLRAKQAKSARCPLPFLVPPSDCPPGWPPRKPVDTTQGSWYTLGPESWSA
jgi:hypothetical protein